MHMPAGQFLDPELELMSVQMWVADSRETKDWRNSSKVERNMNYPANNLQGNIGYVKRETRARKKHATSILLIDCHIPFSSHS